MATLTEGNTYSQLVAGDQTVAISVPHNTIGKIRFVPSNSEAITSDMGVGTSFGPLPLSKTFGPWGQAGTVYIICEVGTITYTVNASTFPNNPVLSAGTANSVAYLDANKNLVSGSVLKFDGTNLGLGVTPSAFGGNYRGLQIGGNPVITGANAPDLCGNAYHDGTNWRYIGTNFAARYSVNSSNGGIHAWYTAPSGNAGDAITFTQPMTLDASGNFLLGQTSTGLQAGRSFSFQGAGDGSCYVSHSTANANGDSYVQFGYNGTKIGSITQSGTTAIAYNTSSDYRLKENIQPMTGALARVAQLKPVTYKWKVDGSDGEGFIAHELAEVCSHAVTGEKDGMRTEQYVVEPEKKVKVTKQRQVTDKAIVMVEQIVVIDGKHVVREVEQVISQPLFEMQPIFKEDGTPALDANGAQRMEAVPVMEEYEEEETVPAVMGEREVPAYQGIDVSFLVGMLTAAVQELSAEVSALKAGR